jgi:hypothetical protein
MIMNMKDISIIILISVFLIGIKLNAQTEETTKPLELPNFIIEGKEQLNVQAGIKQMPNSPKPMTAEELDSLSKIEKQQSLLLPSVSLPKSIYKKSDNIGFLKAGFDSYITPKVSAGVNLEINDHATIFGSGNYEYSIGHVDKADYSRSGINIISDYIAPEKYWVFGGSKTQTHAKFFQQKFLPYASKDPADRSSSGFDIGIHSEGKHEGYKFATGAALNSIDISDNLKTAVESIDETSLKGWLSLTGMFKGFEIGGDILIDFRSVNDVGTNFFKGAGIAKYYDSDITFNVLAGIEHAVSNVDIQRTGLLLDINAIYRLDHNFTLKGGVHSGFKPTSLSDVYVKNPYIARELVIDHDYTQNVSGLINYHPHTDIQASLGVQIGTGSRTPYYKDINEYFILEYGKTQKILLEAEIDWTITMHDNLTFYTSFDHCVLKSNQNYLPYNPMILTSANYRKKWNEQIGTKIGFYYIGERYADYENKESLSGYIDLKLSADYKFSENLSVFFDLNNITNSDIYVWKNYKERSIYLSAGVLWQF